MLVLGGGGMMGGGSELGPGWQESNGMYGVIFRFTTSGHFAGAWVFPPTLPHRNLMYFYSSSLSSPAFRVWVKTAMQPVRLDPACAQAVLSVAVPAAIAAVICTMANV
jgi:hypothetical protein